MFGRGKTGKADNATTEASANGFRPSKAQLKRATRTRLIWALITSFLLLVSLVFVILVELGSTNSGQSSLTNIYFINLDLSEIVPISVPDATLINSIARTLGLHDFYRVGLWGFCEGYNGEGVTYCSPPQTLYWFNPVEILQSELLAGASIALPAEINQILNLIQTVSKWMFGLYLAGAVVTFIMIFIVPLSIYSRWAALPISILTFLAALLTTVATIIATVLFIIMQNALTSASQLNIGASIGDEMFAFMWIAAGSAILAWLIQMGLCCCCASRRDVSTGRKKGSAKAWRTGVDGGEEKENGKNGSAR